MGGKSLKDNGIIVTSRLDLKKYLIIKEIVVNFISINTNCDIIPELPDKDSFGDLDVLYIGNENVINFVKDYFKPKYEYYNGNIYSFSLDCSNYIDKNLLFQIDMILVENLEMAKCYFSYGDVGKILGAIVNHYNLKYGYDGLWCYVEKQNFIEKLILTSNPKEIFDFLGLDYDYYMDEIPKLKKHEYNKIYDWIMRSKFFNNDVFNNLNNHHRRYLRPFYLDFFKYINVDINNSKGNNKITNYDVMPVIKYFKKEDEYSNIIKKYDMKESRKKKFNQMEFIGLYFHIKGKKLVNKEIGTQINIFMEYCSKNMSWNDFLDSNTYESIKDRIMDFLLKN